MNLKEELQKLNITDLKSICKELGLSCPTDKKNIIKKLLEPLKKRKKYNMNSKNDIEMREIPAKYNITYNCATCGKLYAKGTKKLTSDQYLKEKKKEGTDQQLLGNQNYCKKCKSPYMYIKIKRKKYRMNSDKEDWELVLDRMEEEEEKERKLYEILRKPVRKYITKKRRTKKRAVKTIERVYKRFKKLKELERKKSKKRMLTKTETKSKAKCILWLINYKFGKNERIPKNIKNLKLKLYKGIKNLEKQDKNKKISDNDKKLRFLWTNAKVNLNYLNSNTLLDQKERNTIHKFVKTYKNVQQINAEKAKRNRKLKERRKEKKIHSEKDKKKARENNLKRGDAMISIKNKTKMDKYLAKTQMCKHGSKCKRKKTCKFAHSKDELIKAICKFGKLCKRSDCYYRHPEGRYIDNKPVANNNLQLKQFMK